LKSTAANAAADNFQPLAARFAERLAAKVPVPQSDATARAALHDFAPEVRSRLIRPELFEICAAAPEGLLAEILFNNTRANLRPTGRGTYCGNFLLPASSLAHTKLIFELRSPFGASLQKPIQLGAYETKK
ncbi:MAG TPA: hypothetical protein PLP17_01720, partial [Oligoflexia bacterium]|nr:hypothetical protein [Oligoflexia bacterium]